MTQRPRHVLLVTFHYPPSAASGSFRLLGFSKYLPALGWKVSVVAPPRMPDEPVDPGLLAQIPRGVDVHAVPYPARVGKVARRFSFPFAVWLLPASLAVARILRTRRPDVVLTSGPPHVVHLVGLWLARLCRTPWVADFRDPWVSDSPRRGRRWFDGWYLACERSVYRHADRILANAPNALDAYRSQHPSARDRIRMLTNGYDPRPVPAGPGRGTGRVFRLVHAGEIYLGRDPRPLLDAMCALRDAMPGLSPELHILGRADVGRAELDRAIEERGLAASVVFRGQVSYQESIDTMAGADINVLFDTPDRRFGVPAKLYEYFGALRPILALTGAEGDSAAILRDSGLLHRIAHPRNAEQIQTALAELVTLVRAGTPAVSDPSRLTRFTREHLSAQLAAMMRELIDGNAEAAP